MIDLQLLNILVSASLIICGICMIFMVNVYNKMFIRLDFLATCLQHIIIQKGVIEYENEIPSMSDE